MAADTLTPIQTLHTHGCLRPGLIDCRKVIWVMDLPFWPSSKWESTTLT